jgi:hypothetical protein
MKHYLLSDSVMGGGPDTAYQQCCNPMHGTRPRRGAPHILAAPEKAQKNCSSSILCENGLQTRSPRKFVDDRLLTLLAKQVVRSAAIALMDSLGPSSCPGSLFIDVMVLLPLQLVSKVTTYPCNDGKV